MRYAYYNATEYSPAEFAKEFSYASLIAVLTEDVADLSELVETYMVEWDEGLRTAHWVAEWNDESHMVSAYVAIDGLKGYAFRDEYEAQDMFVEIMEANATEYAHERAMESALNRWLGW